MTRDNLLFVIIGILLGFIGGFLLAGNITQREAAQRAMPMTAPGSQNLPQDHPPIGSTQQASGQSGQMLETVQLAIKKARENPNDFDAQLTAAKMYYQIQRLEPAIEYLLAANKIKPTDFDTLAMLGVANLDAGHFDAAEKWYKAALQKKPDDMPTVDGYCAALLSNSKAKEAEDCINKLTKIDPTNQDLPQFHNRLSDLKAGKK